ncbi:hypothetical protein PR202_gb01212 [Eleusine coracana subsp. coracana]|uniref:Uncharacterized protein n=1 Tax=Eleusine coracana subsp. coracana TaxID=191504 RepID=A0AAV5DVW2_ELECO|nr:hypothetical protein PR202_gb01212 [Eleusine coracana subsp. coracana]
MLGEGPWEEGEGPDDMWLKMATCVRKVASEVFGVSRGGKQEAKDTWWWNDKVQRAIKEKKECFKRLHLDKSATNIEGYKIAKRAAKRAVSVAKGQAYDNLYQRLGTKEGEKDIYRMARIRERKTRDINQIKCIKDGVDRLLVRDEEIKDRWREYFDKLFNGEEEGPILELDDSFDDNNRRFVRRIQETEIEEALKRMKSGKAMGPDGIPIDVTHSVCNFYKSQVLVSFNYFQELKKLQEQFAAEQGPAFGAKPSPIRPLPARKPLGQSSNVNIVGGTPSRRVLTPMSRKGGLSSGKVKEAVKATATPANYVALPKNCTNNTCL